ncbi:MAG TPA: WD40 repeat domain-containing protein, partial [Planctomycetaceae bacterium]|nr:WD40 repeat domain-containing protein [Planctomycetaceae bacterium]
VLNIADNREIARFEARGNREILLFSFSPDGRYLATTHYPGYGLTVWDIDRREIAVNDRGSSYSLTARFSPDSQRIAVARGDGEFLMYNLSAGRPVQTWSIPPNASDLAFRADGRQIAIIHSGTRESSCRIIDANSGEPVRTIALSAGGSIAWSPDGTTLAISTKDLKFQLWDIASGAPRASLEGSRSGGMHSTFHPTAAILASNGWEGRLRIWDTAMGRHVFSIAAGNLHDLLVSQDGQLFVSRGNQSLSYSVDPAPAYRSLTRVPDGHAVFGRLAIRNDGRLLAMATNQGVVLWDLARGTELTFLPIGPTVHVLFEPSGSLLTCSTSSTGVHRWRIQLDRLREVFRIGPPRRLALPPGMLGFAADRAGETMALAYRHCAAFTSGERIVRVGLLYDCRHVALTPDGQWLATGSHSKGAQVWRVSDAKRAAVLPIDEGTAVVFSPDGKRLMTANPCRLWTVGTWREERQIDGGGMCFSPDGRSVVVQDADHVLNLVDAETGSVLARFKSPDSCEVVAAAFTPDGSRLAFSTNDGPAVHVWDLRTVRTELATLGLDWNAPA